MKYLLTLIILLPLIGQSKNKFANACDSLQKTIVIKNTEKSVIISNTLNQLQNYKFSNAKEKIAFSKQNDSVIVVIGTVELHKTRRVIKDRSYGYYKVHHAGDGFVDFTLVITFANNMFHYTVQSTKHYGCRTEIGNICKDSRKDNVFVNGIKITFKQRIDRIIKDLTFMY